jgi:hypothetical protein
MACRCLKCLEGDLRGIALYISSIDYHLNHSIPDLEERSIIYRSIQESDLFGNEIARETNQFQHDVQVPFVIDRIFLAQDSDFQDLTKHESSEGIGFPQRFTISSRMV